MSGGPEAKRVSASKESANRESLPVWKALGLIQRAGMMMTGVGVTGIVAAVCILRVFKINFQGFEEILVMVVFWLYMLGCSYGAFEKSHITANLVELLLREGRLKQVLTVLKDVITVAVCAVIFVWALRFFVEACGLTGQRPPMTTVFRLPMAAGYLSMVAGFGLSLFYFACYTWDMLAKLVKGAKA